MDIPLQIIANNICHEKPYKEKDIKRYIA